MFIRKRLEKMKKKVIEKFEKMAFTKIRDQTFRIFNQKIFGKK